MQKIKKKAAVFFDRDGTINEEVGYLDSIDKLALYPQSGPAIKLVNESGMEALVVTNQSGVARGYFTEEFVCLTHRLIEEEIALAGARIDAFFYCPHHPTEGSAPYRRTCRCRKPGRGMLVTAARQRGIDLKRSYMVGDTIRDVEAGATAGVKSILVRTGYGLETERELCRLRIRADYIAADILEAVHWIIGDCRK